MALIKCEECEKEISDKARFCPKCGAENKFTFCPDCNNKVSRNALSCPNCGCIINIKNDNATIKQSNNFGIVGLTTGIISLFIDFYGIVGIIGLVFSIIGYNDQSSKNRKRASWGIVLSAIDLIYRFIQFVNI